MHRVFIISEIFRLICEELGRLGGTLGRRTLARVARTCRTFQEPALYVLWYDLNSLLPLIQCMPPDLWKTTRYREGRWPRAYKLSFERPILPTDWPRFTANAQRVRQFSWNTSSVLHATELQTLSTAGGAQHLLPRLIKLTWKTEDDTIFPFIHLFLGPQTGQLDLWLGKASSVRLSLLATLNLRYPALTHVSISSMNQYRHLVDTVDAVSAVVLGWNHLRRLSVTTLSADALCHVATLPSLTKLKLRDVRNASTLSGFPAREDVCYFPSLEDLYVTSQGIAFCVRLVMMMSSSPDLTSVHIKIRTPSTSSQWQNLICAIQRHCHHSSVTSITMESDSIQEHDPEECLLRFCGLNHLRPLYSFSNLNTLHLRPDCVIDLDDTDVQELAYAWPHMHALTLFGLLVTDSPRVTLPGLVPLAQNCPQLTELSISFDGRSAPHPKREPQGCYSTALTYLHIQESPIAKPLWVAAFLTDIFPELSIVDCGVEEGDECTEDDQSWMKVQNLIHIFTSVRSQERQKCAAAKLLPNPNRLLTAYS